MVRAQDDVVPQQQQQQSQSSSHQFVDPAMLKLLHKTENLFEFDDIAAAWDSPPDTPSSVSSDEAFARGDVKSEWDALFQDTMDGPKSDSSSASSPASATSAAAVPSSGTSSSPLPSSASASSSSSVMWNFDLPLSHLDNFEHELFHGSHHLFSGHSSATTIASSASNSSLAAVMASAAHMHAMPDLDFSHGLEMDVFGLDSGAVPPPPPPTPVALSPAVPSAASTPSATAASASSSSSSTTSSSKSGSSSTSSAKISVHKPHIRAIVFDKKKTTVSALDKRKNSEDDSMEAKKARARQTRDEIVAKTQAALRQGVKGDNPEMRRITHNVLERKRREDLKVSYQELRSFVPEVMHNDRAPTGQILGKAVDYIHALRAEEHELMQKLAAMRQENERLRNRLL